MRPARLGVRMDSLLLSCRTLSFPIACRFIPAHGLSHWLAAGLEAGRHETRSARRNRKLVFARNMQAVEPVLQMGARAQDHGSRPFHQLTHFGQTGRGETCVAQLLGQPGGALHPQELGPDKFSGTYSLANRFKRE